MYFEILIGNYESQSQKDKYLSFKFYALLHFINIGVIGIDLILSALPFLNSNSNSERQLFLFACKHVYLG